ncbi:MAG: PilZ domain-containing protein [Pseudobacteriovorax sp.]|nr:PilZ domain-containing protein [Pseudobacteriovorax sp.]
MSKIEVATQRDEHGVHGTILPIEIRNGTGVQGKLITDKGNHAIEILRLSPAGIEVTSDKDLATIGTNLVIELSLAGQNIQHQVIVVSEVESEWKGQQHFVYGMRWIYAERSVPQVGEPRGEKRWPCNSLFPPTITAPNILNYEDMVILRMVDLSAEGARAVTSLRNKSLVPGLKLEGVFSFPITGSISCKFEIRWTKEETLHGKKELNVGLKFVEKEDSVKRVFGEYLAQFGDVQDLNDLRKSGFYVKSVHQSLQVRYAKTESELNQVIELRKKAYVEYMGDDNIDIKELYDKEDAKSRVILATHFDRSVATSRVVFFGEDDVPEVYQKIPLPDSLKKKNLEIVEISRFCIDKGYRSSDIFLGLVRESFLVMVQAKRPILIGATPEHLIEHYRSVGITVFKEHYYSPESCPELKLYLLQLDLRDVLTGNLVSAKVYESVYAPLLLAAQENGILDLDLSDQINVYKKRILGKIMSFVR